MQNTSIKKIFKFQTRLNGLAMMSIHRDEQCLTVDAVLTELGKTKRRLDFIL